MARFVKFRQRRRNPFIWSGELLNEGANETIDLLQVLLTIPSVEKEVRISTRWIGLAMTSHVFDDRCAAEPLFNDKRGRSCGYSPQDSLSGTSCHSNLVSMMPRRW